MAFSNTDKRRLDETGFFVLERFIDRELLAALRARLHELFAEEGESAGSEFKQEPGCGRLANLVDKGDVFQRVISAPEVLECVQVVVGSQFKLSSLNARSVEAYSDCTQPLHADMRAVADELGFWVCNSVWMLDDFTPENGAMRIIPGSHRWGRLPQDVLADPIAPHPDQKLVTGKAGTVVVMNAHLWHGGLANRTASPRLGLHAFYCRRDKPQQQNQKQLIRAEVQKELSRDMRRLLALDDTAEMGREPGEPLSGFLD